MKDVIIVGSGPAGLSAAIYTSRADLSTLILGGLTPGGLLKSTEMVDNYIGLPEAGGADMGRLFVEHAQKFGAELKSEVVTTITKDSDGAFTVTTLAGEYRARVVIFAAGSEPKKLAIPGDGLEGVSYCATCDGAFFAGDPVAVVGGGETAAEDALYLSKVASSVDVFVRSSWRATAPAVALLEAQPNVTIHMGESLEEIFEEEGVVSGLRTVSGATHDVYGVFVAVGQDPNSAAADGHVTLFSDGFVQETTSEGFFVAGDICDPDYRQVAVAVGAGAKAGIEATRFALALS